MLLTGVGWCQLGTASSLQSWRYAWLGLCLSPSVANPKSHLPILFDCWQRQLCKRQCWQTWCHQMMTYAFYMVNTVFFHGAGFLSKDTFLWTEYSNPAFLINELLQGVFIVVSQLVWKASLCWEVARGDSGVNKILSVIRLDQLLLKKKSSRSIFGDCIPS